MYDTPICFSIPYIGKIFDNSGCKLDLFEENYNFVGQAIPIGTEASTLSIGLMNYFEFAYANTYFTILPFIAGLILLYTKKDKLSLFIFINFVILGNED